MWHMGDGWGWWMVFGTLMMVGFWGVLIWAVAALVRGPSNGPERPARRDPTAMEILERRYVSGDLSDEEFETRRRRLSGEETSLR